MMATQNDPHAPMSDDPVQYMRVALTSKFFSFSLSPFPQHHLAREGNEVVMLPINPPGPFTLFLVSKNSDGGEYGERMW